MYCHAVPEWFYQLDTNEKLIAFLKFIGREDLVTKFETYGYLYASELLNADEPQWVEDWNTNMVKSDNVIDFINFDAKEEL